MEYLRFFLFVILFLGECVFLVRNLRISTHHAPLIVILGNTLIVFLFSLLKLLTVGYIFCITLSIVLFIVDIVFHFKNKTVKQKLFSESNIPIFAFLLIIVACFISTRGTLFYKWDEFSHWGVIYKYLSITRQLPINTDTVALTYPPLTAIWQFITTMSITAREDNVYFAQFILQYSLLIALLPAPKPKRIMIYTVSLFVFFFSLCFFGFAIWLTTLYIDLIIALLLAVGFAQIPLKGGQSFSQFLSLVLVTTAITLTKPLSPILGLTLILLFIVYILRVLISEKKKIDLGQLLRIAIVVIVPLLFLVTWNLHVKDFKTYSNISFTFKSANPIKASEIYPTQPELYMRNLKIEGLSAIEDSLMGKNVDIEISVEDILKAFTVKTSYYIKTVSTEFVKTFSDGAKQSVLLFPLKYYLVLIVLIFFITQAVLRRVNQGQQKSHRLITGVHVLGFILYTIALYLAYCFFFIYETNIATVPSFDRYFITFLLPMWLFNFGVLYQAANDEEKPVLNTYFRWISVGFIIVTFLLVPTQHYIHLPPSPSAYRGEVQDAYMKISDYPFSPSDKIYEVRFGEEENGLRHYIMRYYLTPIASNMRGWSFRIKRDPENLLDISFSPEEWFGLLNSQKYSYVLVTKSDARFWIEYGSLFDKHLMDFDSPQLFLVTKDKLVFIPIEEK